MKKRIRAILTLVILLSMLSCGKKTVQSVHNITSKSGIEMVYLPGGEFIMGESSSAHKVRLSPFYIDKYEVTQGMFKKLGLTDTSHFKGEKRPAEMTTYTSADIYCNERSLEEGLTPCYDEKTWECNFDANGFRCVRKAEQ